MIEAISYFLPWGSHTGGVSKCYSCSRDCFSANLCLNIPCDSLHKSCFYKIGHLIFKKMKFNIVPNWKMNKWSMDLDSVLLAINSEHGP